MSTTQTYSSLGSATTLLSTGLNSLSSGSSVTSASIDNTAGHLYMGLELALAATSSRTAGDNVQIYLLGSIDGTTFCDATSPCAPQLCQFNLDAATTARTITIMNLAIPPGKFELVLTNKLSVSFAGSGTTLRYCFYDELST